MASETNTTTSMGANEEVRFCSYCGTKLDGGARFCKNCGKTVGQPTNNTKDNGIQTASTVINEPITKRKTVYEGYIHKCPNCGEVLESFTTNCPSCGYEIRETKAASAVREFALKLEQTEAQKMPIFEEKKSVIKMVFGKDLKEKDAVEEAKDNFEEQKQKQKATLIINYTVPNTREDITEFIILATSNIDVKQGIDDAVSKAWISKLEQVYQKAEISMGNSSDFGQIKNIYEKKKKQLKEKKIKSVLLVVGIIVLYFFLMGLLWNPIATIAIFAIILVLLIIGFVIFKKR